MITNAGRAPMFGHRIVLFLVFAVIIASANPAQSQDQPQPAKSAESESTPDSKVSSCQGDEREVGTPVQGRTVAPGLLIKRVEPKYPKTARKAKIEGTVVVCAVIGKDGRVRNLQVGSGPSELVPSVIQAVRQWVYKPYLLDGKPVEVDTTIHVSFKLN